MARNAPPLTIFSPALWGNIAGTRREVAPCGTRGKGSRWDDSWALGRGEGGKREGKRGEGREEGEGGKKGMRKGKEARGEQGECCGPLPSTPHESRASVGPGRQTALRVLAEPGAGWPEAPRHWRFLCFHSSGCASSDF